MERTTTLDVPGINVNKCGIDDMGNGFARIGKGRPTAFGIGVCNIARLLDALIDALDRALEIDRQEVSAYISERVPSLIR